MPVFSALLYSLLSLAFVLPLFFVDRSVFASSSRKYLFLFAGFVIADAILLQALKGITLFEGSNWNWAGKLGELALVLLFLCFVKVVSKKEIGITFNVHKPARVFVVLFLVLIVMAGVFYMYAGVRETHSIEIPLFQLLPAINEELIFRGILLALLNKIFIKRVKIFGASLGWGVVITSVLFGLAHGFYFTIGENPSFDIWYFANTFAWGLAYCYIKEYSQSLLPGILFHYLYNLILIYL